MDHRFERLNQYRNMWVMVLYDLPTDTKRQRKIAASFRKLLLKDGFSMFQFSSYMRFCVSRESADVHIKRIKARLPGEGKIGVLRITDKQYEMMEIFYGHRSVDKEVAPQQLELF